MKAGILHEHDHSSLQVVMGRWEMRMGVFRYSGAIDLPWFHACCRDDRRMGASRAKMWHVRLDVFAMAVACKMTSTEEAQG